jgi:hypothetical protein
MRTLQEWMGHRDFATTLRYAGYSPDERRERDLIERAFEADSLHQVKLGSNLRGTGNDSEARDGLNKRERH